MSSSAEPAPERSADSSSQLSPEEIADCDAKEEEWRARWRVNSAKITAEAKRRGVTYEIIADEKIERAGERIRAVEKRIVSGEFSFWNAVEQLEKAGMGRNNATRLVEKLMGLCYGEHPPNPKKRSSGAGI